MCFRAHGQPCLEGHLHSGRNQANQDRRGLRSCSASVWPRDLCKDYSTNKTEKTDTKYEIADKDSKHLINQGEQILHLKMEDGIIRAETSDERCGHERCQTGCLLLRIRPKLRSPQGDGHGYEVHQKQGRLRDRRQSSAQRFGSSSRSTPEFCRTVWFV